MKNGRILFLAALLLLAACSDDPSDQAGTDLYADTVETDNIIIIKKDVKPTDAGDAGSVDARFDGRGETGQDEIISECDPGTGCFLDPCEEGDDCLSGICVDHMGDSVCTVTCVEECPDGWECEQIGAGPDGMFACLSPYTHLCRPCADATDCTSPTGVEDVCVEYGPDGDFCGAACAGAGECPSGFSCETVKTVDGVETEQCKADAGLCECTDKSVALALWTNCEVTTDWGTCIGKRVCTEDGLSDCDAGDAAEETCNGLDDDCDGDVDEAALVDGDFVNVCDDANDCTDDSCAGEAGCEYAPLDGGECADGDPCTVADHCVQGTCVPGGQQSCDDDNQCTDDWCDPGVGCVNEPNAIPCEDGNACTTGDTCAGGVCSAGTGALDCADENICTDDWCIPETGCANDPIPNCCNFNAECEDSDPCTNDACVANGCKNTFTPGCCKSNPDCDDGDFCTEDSCAANVCFNAPIAGCCKSDLECN